MKTLICDLDNTLVECTSYYRKAVHDAAQEIARWTGASAESVVRAIDLTDGDLIKLRQARGFQVQRFGDSIKLVADHYGNLSNESLPSLAISKAALATVTEGAYPLFPGVWGTLETYRKHDWRIVLWTKGEDWLQLRKVNKNRLYTFIDYSDICVTGIKSTDRFEEFLEDYQIDRASAVMVGDSMRDDIEPALALGMHAVHVHLYDAGPPGYETGDTHMVTIERFEQLPEVVRVEGHGAATSTTRSEGSAIGAGHV